MTDLPEMPCQELVEVITDYLEDALSETDRVRFEEHLSVCEPCRDYVQQFRETITLTGRVAPEDLSPNAREDLLTAFRAWRARG